MNQQHIQDAEAIEKAKVLAEQNPTPPSKLTREQQRTKERIEAEAENVYTLLTEKFLKFFMDHDNPEDPSVEIYIKELSAKWGAYSRKKRLLPSGYGLVENYCREVIDDYRRSKAPLPDPRLVGCSAIPVPTLEEQDIMVSR